MEDRKNITKLDEEKLEQVAGGSGDGITWFTECHEYQFLCELKKRFDEERFHNEVVYAVNNICPRFKNNYCVVCPVKNWLK